MPALGFRRSPEPPAHARGRPRHDRRSPSACSSGTPWGPSAPTQLAAETGLAADPHPDDPHEPALQRLDPPASRPGRDAPSGAMAARPARLGRSLGAGRGRAAGEDPRWGTPPPRSRGPARRPPGMRLRSADPVNDGRMADGRPIASCTRSRAPPGARRPASRRSTWEAPVARPARVGIRVDDAMRAQIIAALSRATVPVDDRPRPDRAPDARARPGARRRRASTTQTYLARMARLRGELDAIVERSRPGPPGASRGRVAATPSRETWQKPRRTRGEGRPDPRHLRADRRRRAALRRPAAHTGGLRARTGAGAAREGCNGAPDRIRTCDLRLRRPTLYPLSYRRAGGRRCGAASRNSTPSGRSRPGNVEAAPEGAASNAVPVKGRPVTRSSSATLQGHLSRRLHRLP